MRTVGLLILIIFFPAFAHAAPPSLTTYTVSQGTIYPGASNDSGLATTTSIDTAFSEQVKVSIKIVSADGATIKSLYSSSGVTNPTPKIWDGTNSAGTLADYGTYTVLISATSTATSLTMTDSSKMVIVASSGSTSPDTSSDSTDTTTTVATASSSGGPPEYIPIPVLRIITGSDRTVSAGADTAFSAVVYDGKGNKRDNALINWSFGDGMQRTGASVFHAYYEPGEYIVLVHASTPDGGDAFATSIVTAKDASITLASVSVRGIALMNNSSRTLDLSLWRLSMGEKEFKIPAGTQILAGRTTLFPSQVIQLPIADSASLLYPSGKIAAAYPQAPKEQPIAPQTSFNAVQTVESAPSTNIRGAAHAGTAVNAPTAATKLAAVGAALSAPPLADPLLAGAETAPVAGTRIPSLFRSPWTLSFLGVMLLAGGAFIFL